LFEISLELQNARGTGVALRQANVSFPRRVVMPSRTRLFLSCLSLFVLTGCSDRGTSGGRVLEARGQGPVPEWTTRRIWNGPDVDVQGSVSPDGKFLSISDWRDGQDGSLAVRDLSTGDIRTLVKATGGMVQFAFADGSLISPDGARVAYAWEDRNTSSLRVVPIAGGEPRTLYENPEARYVQALAWSPDGSQILMEINMLDRTNRLGMIAYPSGNVRILKSFDWRTLQAAAFSPDGRFIVYGIAPDTSRPQRDLYLLNADGSREITISDHAADDRLLGWPRGGNAVWFLSDRGGSPAVWSVDVVDGRVQGSPALVKADLWRTVNGLGFDRAGSMYYAVSPTSRQVYVTTLDPSATQLLIPPAPAAEGMDMQNNADWSPDGKMLAYASRPMATRNRIMIRTMQSGEVRELTPSMRYIQGVLWAPDGQSLYARGQDEQGRYGAYRIDARTGTILAAYRRPDFGGFNTMTIAPDGSALYYSGRLEGSNKDESAILRHDLKTDRERVLRTFKGNGGGPSVSPDGRQLAFTVNEATPDEPASIWVMDADGTNARSVYRLPKGTASPPYRGPVIWTEDARHLLFVMTGGGGGTSLWRVSTAGGDATNIAVDLPSIRAFRLHPDGKRLAFDAGDPSFEVWVMVRRVNTTSAR
jgi:Tol biopolymer transport system component